MEILLIRPAPPASHPNYERARAEYDEAIGLDPKFAYNIIKKVGNYGEIFERNVGQGSPIKIARGLNALWNKGGLQYAPPIR